MKADQVVAWCNGAIKGCNKYESTSIAKACNEVKGVSAGFLYHRESKKLFFIDWKIIFGKYFSSLPSGYRGYYFFEIDERIVTMQHLATTSKEEQICVPLI
jgi:hypothetical protein